MVKRLRAWLCVCKDLDLVPNPPFNACVTVAE